MGESKEKNDYLKMIKGLLNNKIFILLHANKMKSVEKEATGDISKTLITRNVKLIKNKLDDINNSNIKERLLRIDRLLSFVK